MLPAHHSIRQITPSLLKELSHFIREEWQVLPAEGKAWGIWLTLHPPLPADADAINLPTQPVLRAWFLRENMDELQERSVWEFARFWIMHFERSWDRTGGAAPDPRFSARCYAIGRASFALCADSNDVYLETRWGRLWGSGWRLTISAHDQVESMRELWRA